jgi:hypothetical protein
MSTTYNVELPHFTGRNVPISEIAKATGKDSQYIRVGLQRGILKFGFAFKKENSSEYNYYCPDKKVWEEIGYFNENI